MNTTVLSEDNFSYSVVLDDAGVEMQVEYDGPVWDDYGMRNQYVMHVRTATEHYVDNTLRSGVGDDIDSRRMWASAVSFLSACGESRSYRSFAGENANLFPGWVMDTISPVIEELEQHAYDIENPEED